MPLKLWNVIKEATSNDSVRYEQQANDPHYLHLTAGEYVFMRHELEDSGKIVERLQRCAAVTSVEHALFEANEVHRYLRSLLRGF